MKKDELRLVAHDAAWAEDFAAEKRRIVAALGGAATIEHVGSTAIPTVHAKPILDLAILCAGETGLAAVRRALVALGYDFRGPYGDETAHFYAVLERNNVRFCQAHVFTEATPDYRSKLIFRDVLSRDADLAREYDEYKLALAARASDKTEYAEIKSRWVDCFISKVYAARDPGEEQSIRTCPQD